MSPFFFAAWLLTAAAPQNEESLSSDPPAKPRKIKSAEYRQDKEYQLTVGPFGSQYFGPFLNFSIFETPDSLFTFSYQSAINIENVLSILLGDQEYTKVNLYTAGYKQFLANSFYYETSVFYRRLRQSAYYYSSAYQYDKEADLSIDSLGAQATVGNQWQWRRFTLGCDWLGFGVPLAHSALKKKEADGFDQENYSRQKKNLRNESREGVLIMLRFYLGFSF